MASSETLAVHELFLSTDPYFFDVPAAKAKQEMLDASNLLQEWQVHDLENDGNYVGDIGVWDLRRELLMRSFSTIEHIYHTWKSEPELPNSAETHVEVPLRKTKGRYGQTKGRYQFRSATGSITNDFDLPLPLSDLLDDMREDVVGPVAEVGQLLLSDVLDELEDIITLLSEDDAPPDMVHYLARSFARLMLRLHREIQAVSLPFEDDLVSAISVALAYFESDYMTEDAPKPGAILHRV
ncbi:hypothetical protein HK405_008297 [Cladochytrium tenue]|nr:hypothetical protein HK405_008297 [Cladochytrium tenue]